jgi:hypothetical protein
MSPGKLGKLFFTKLIAQVWTVLVEIQGFQALQPPDIG